MKPVAIVGNVANDQPPYDDPNIEIWAFNSGARKKPRLDVAFQMHDPPGYLCNGPEYMDWLRHTTTPVYMRERRDEFPTSIAYPFDEVFAMTENIKLRGKPLRYFTSSPSEAIALAVLQNRPRIELYGIELMDNKEYRDQRECFSFWVAFAGGKGVPVELHCAGSIFNKRMYGTYD